MSVEQYQRKVNSLDKEIADLEKKKAEEDLSLIHIQMCIRDKLKYEREFLAKTSKDINMGFGAFVDIYMGDLRPQLEASTCLLYTSRCV